MDAPKTKPIKADTQLCRQAVSEFVAKLTSDQPTPALKYRHLAHAFGLLKLEVTKAKVAARKARLQALGKEA